MKFFSVHKKIFQSLLEFALRPYKKRECGVEEYSLSATLTESDKKSTEPTTSRSEEREMIPPPTNFEDRMKNVFEAIVELHLTICYPVVEVMINTLSFCALYCHKIGISPFSLYFCL